MATLHLLSLELGMGVHERVLQSGMLSKIAYYRVVVSGPVGVAEIERLVKKLEMDKEILADLPPGAAGGFGRTGVGAGGRAGGSRGLGRGKPLASQRRTTIPSTSRSGSGSW